jgi:hypothetical protein
MLGGGGIGEDEASAVTGAGGIGEHEGSAVTGGGGIEEQPRAVLGGGGISDPERAGREPGPTRRRSHRTPYPYSAADGPSGHCSGG